MRETVHGDGEHEGSDGEAGEEAWPLERVEAAPREHDRRHDAREAAPERDPRDERRAAVCVVPPEVAGVDLLEHDPGRERERNDEHSQGARQHCGTAREREGERHEAGGAARLRQRDEIGEVGEEKRTRARARE